MLEHQLAVGRTYRFTFKPEFERHGVCSSGQVECIHPGGGTFTLQQISTYGDIVAAGINLFKNFFEPLGLTEDEYRAYFSGRPADAYTPEYAAQSVSTVTAETVQVADPEDPSKTVQVTRNRINVAQRRIETGNSRLKKEYLESLAFASYPIYKLVDVVNPDDVVYAPEKAIKGFPEVDLINYKQLSLNIDIGYWDDPQKLTPMLQAVRERLHTYGVPPLNIQLFTAESAWMNEKEYEAAASIRIPGFETCISQENASSILGRKIIANGTLYEVVDDYSYALSTDTEAKEGKQYYTRSTNAAGKAVFTASKFAEDVYERVNNLTLIDNIIRQPGATIDNNLFMTKLKPVDDIIFTSGQKYYLALGNSKYRQLMENVDWHPGDIVPHYIPTTDTERVEGKKYFKTKPTSYESLPIEYGFAAAQQLKDNGVQVYTHTVTYTQCNESMSIDPSTTYYRCNNNEGVLEFEALVTEELETLTSDIYTITNDVYTEVESVTDENAQYFVKGRSGMDEAGADDDIKSLYEQQDIYVLNYASDDAIAKVGMRFAYTDRMNSLIEKELAASDLIMIATEKLPGIRISNEIVYNKFKGRWFEYVEEGKRYVVILNDDNWATVQSKIGVICGETGDLWRNVFIADDGAMARNYYKLYMDECILSSKLKAKCDAQQQLINALVASTPAT